MRIDNATWGRLLFLFVGLGLLVGAGIAGWGKHEFIRSASHAHGVVTRLNAGGSHPEVEFTTAVGVKISSPQGGWIFNYRPGDQVDMLYHPDNPTGSACIDTVGGLWFAPIFLFALGIICVGASSFELLRARSK